MYPIVINRINTFGFHGEGGGASKAPPPPAQAQELQKKTQTE